MYYRIGAWYWNSINRTRTKEQTIFITLFIAIVGLIGLIGIVLECTYKNLFVVLYVGGLYYFILKSRQMESKLCPVFRHLSKNIYFVHLLFVWFFSQATDVCEKIFDKQEIGVFLFATVASFSFSIILFGVSLYKERRLI